MLNDINELYFFRKRVKNILLKATDLFQDKVLVSNKQFKGIHKGNRCFILGSGHSIKNQDLTLLENEIVFTQNHFHAHEDIRKISPDYHVVVPKHQPKEYNADWEIWLNGMEEKLSADTKFFFGKNTKPLVDKHPGLVNRSFYMQAGFNAIVAKMARIDLTKRTMNVPTVITQCITIAIYMGFEKIYLVGFDLDQIFQLSKGRENVRFYGHSPITNNKAEHSGLDVFESTGYIYFVQWAIWQQLILQKNFAKKNNQHIINLADGGVLNVFERQNYYNVIKQTM